MTEHAPDRVWSGIDIPKTIAGVLAALSAAVIGSFLGVAGTLAGAAIASLIGSVGTELYKNFIHKGREKIQSSFTTAPAAVGTPPVAAAEDETPSDTAAPRQIHWKRIGLVAASLFVLAMAALTAVELVAGKSIADATRGGSGDGSTITSVFSGDRSGTDEQRTTPVPAESSAPAGDDNPTTAPADPATTEPAQQPTTRPTTEAPTGDSGGTDTTAPDQDNGNNGAPKADTQNPDNGTE